MQSDRTTEHPAPTVHSSHFQEILNHAARSPWTGCPDGLTYHCGHSSSLLALPSRDTGFRPHSRHGSNSPGGSPASLPWPVGPDSCLWGQPTEADSQGQQQFHLLVRGQAVFPTPTCVSPRVLPTGMQKVSTPGLQLGKPLPTAVHSLVALPVSLKEVSLNPAK